ncbi:MAG: hypothetical protein ACRC9P_07560, partial [Bacteroides sp.]
KWHKGAAIELVLDKVYLAEQLAIDLSEQNLPAWLEVAISSNGENWKKIAYNQSKNRVVIDLKDKPILRVKLINKLEDKEVKFRQIQLQIKK